MILKIKFSKSEWNAFVKASVHYFDVSKELLNSYEYLHFYNLKSIVQKCIKKQVWGDPNIKKNYLFQLSVNEYNSFRYIYTIAEMPDNYTDIVIQNIFTNLDKQILDLNHQNLYYNGKENNHNNIGNE